MSNVVLKVENLSKRYVIGHQLAKSEGLRHVLERAIRAPLRWMREGFGSNAATREEFWALRDINFEIQEGEVIGIIGSNGAGKSTLLKILSRITEPTEGRIRIQGRVASLLEVGTGFHPELTGRENIFLNGAILGMSQSEIRKKFDSIVAFAGVERFLDTPVKRYSSGMYVRLAFAVAAHLEPEILIVDEVLAVGDAAFQRKCLGKMGDVAREGRTVLLVSHNMASIGQLCSNVIWMDAGRIRLRGKTEEVISQYLTVDSQLEGHRAWEEGTANPGVDEMRLFSVSICSDRGEISAMLDSRKDFSIALEYEILKPLPHCRIGFSITNTEGICLFQAYDTDIEELPGERLRGRFMARCQIPGHLLSPGSYLLSINAGMVNVRNLVRLENLLLFRIEDTGSDGSIYSGDRMGIIHPDLRWSVEQIGSFADAMAIGTGESAEASEAP